MILISINIITLTASTSFSTSTPDKVFDGSILNTMWISAPQKPAISSTAPKNVNRSKEKWASIKGITPLTFNKLEIKLNGVRFSDKEIYNLYDYYIQTSRDGKSWTSIKEVRDNKDSINLFTFDTPITTTYLRVYSETPVDPQYASKHATGDMAKSRITDVNIFNNDVNVVNPPKEYNGRFLHERDILNSEMRSKIEFNNNLVNYKTWVADDQNSMFTEISLDESVSTSQKIKIELTAPETHAQVTNTKGNTADTIWL